MEGSGVFATREEYDDLMHLAMQGWMPGDTVIVTSIMHGIAKDQKTFDARKACHSLALSHGLPEIQGFYGMGKDREFLKT